MHDCIAPQYLAMDNWKISFLPWVSGLVEFSSKESAESNSPTIRLVIHAFASVPLQSMSRLMNIIACKEIHS